MFYLNSIYLFKLLILSLFFITFLSKNVLAIKCFQCVGSDSERPFQCNEWLDDYDLEPESCDNVYNAQYCIKHVGRFEGGIGAKRYCSSLDLGNYCYYVKNKGDLLELRSCIYTCTGDGCNGGLSLQKLPLTSLLLLGMILMYFNL